MPGTALSSFVDVVDAASDETGSTTATWADPAVRLFAAKIHELCGLGFADVQTFGEAYEACQRRAQEAAHERVS